MKKKSSDQKSKVYGDKVMKKIGNTPIYWATEQINPQRYGGYYTSYHDELGHLQTGEISISEINKELNAEERRKVFSEMLEYLQNDDAAREVEQELEEERSTKKLTGRDKKYEGYTAEEAFVLSGLEKKNASMRKLKNKGVSFDSMPYEVKYILAKRAILSEIRKCNEALKDKDAERTEARRVEDMRKHQEQLRKEQAEKERKREELRKALHPEAGDDY